MDFPAAITESLREARRRTISLVDDLNDEQMMGPRLEIVNPLLWEIGHVSWFQERWVLRHVESRPPIRTDSDALYDSAAVAHDTRWDLRLPSRPETLDYMRAARDAVIERLRVEPLTPELVYFTLLGVFHED